MLYILPIFTDIDFTTFSERSVPKFIQAQFKGKMGIFLALISVHLVTRTDFFVAVFHLQSDL